MCLPAAGRREKNEGVAFAFLAAGFAFLLFWEVATFFLGRPQQPSFAFLGGRDLFLGCFPRPSFAFSGRPWLAQILGDTFAIVDVCMGQRPWPFVSQCVSNLISTSMLFCSGKEAQVCANFRNWARSPRPANFRLAGQLSQPGGLGVQTFACYPPMVISFF